jgi:hypothetical protein
VARQYAVPGLFSAFLNETNVSTETLAGSTLVFETSLSSVAPGVGSLVFTGFAPTPSIAATTTTFLTAGKRAGQSAVVAETGLLTFVTALPAVVTETRDTSLTAAPGAGSIVFTGFAPTTGTDAAVSPGAGSIVFTGFAPSTTGDGVVSPGVGAIVFTGAAPTVDTTVAPAAGAITLTGFAPTTLALSAGGPMFAMIV